VVLGFNLITWLDRHSGSVSALLTLVLVVITAVYVALTSGLLKEARTERSDRREREVSEQARLVGGDISYKAYETRPRDAPEGTSPLTLTVTNESPLPVRAVVGQLSAKDTTTLLQTFPHYIVTLRHETRTTLVHLRPEEKVEFELHLEYDDDAGIRWRKYESHDRPLRRLEGKELEASRHLYADLIPS
jgi:hypothetical protein